MYENSMVQVKCPIHSDKNIQMFCLNSTCSNKRLMCVSCVQNHKQHHICNFNLAKAAINEQETIFATHTNAFNNRMEKIQFKLKEIGETFRKCIGTLCRTDIIDKIKETLREEQNFIQLERLTELVGSNFEIRNQKLELITKSEHLNKVAFKLKVLTEKFEKITTVLSDKNSIQQIQIQSHQKLESLLEPLNLEFNKRLSIVFECKNSCNLVGFHQPIPRMTKKQEISLKYQLLRNEIQIHSEIIVLSKLADDLNYEIKFKEPILLVPNNIYEISMQTIEGNMKISYYEQVIQETNYFLQLIDVQGGQFPVLLIMDA